MQDVCVTKVTFPTNVFIMEKMKRFILMFVAVMFFANTFAVSAWAKPCVNMDMQPSIETLAEVAEILDVDIRELLLPTKK